MKISAVKWLGFLLLTCSAKMSSQVTQASDLNLRVHALSPRSLQITWDRPSTNETLVGYSLVFVPALQRRRTHVELFVNQFTLTNLHPGIRYRVKLAPLMNNGKLRGAYSSWVNARTLEENTTAAGQNPYTSNSHSSTGQASNSNCSRISQLCQNIGYKFTQMPNYFKQQNYNDAEYELSQFTPMVQSNCSSVLQLFLCSLYFPPCAPRRQTTPPCRSVCRAAKENCEPWMKKSGLKWPYKFECNTLPDPHEKACVRRDGAVIKVPPHCQPLNSTMCKNLNYIYVEMPNFWGDNTQEEADARIQVFSPLVNSGCSPSLRVFLCLLYFPPCVVNFRKMIPPCRELCEDARRGCKPALEGAGFPWPGIMKCSQFPFYDKNESNVCLKPETQTTKVPNFTQSRSQCQPLKIPMCRSLNYTHTILPNFMNHTTQAEVKRALKAFRPLLKSKCSNQLRRFVCFLFAPFCGTDGTPLALPPCQSFCEKIKLDCGRVSRWLANLNCSRFPTLSRKRLCFGDPLATMDCIGRNSRPCTVISSTSPIILKCSSPGIHFTIDAVTISRYNGTNIFMSSTADALRQCNRSQRLVEGRHECQFDVNYDKLGIDMLSVIAVVVKYHCLSG